VILIDAQGLGASRPNRPLFTDLSLTLSDGDRIGVVGLNGCGKSTLLAMMSGDREPEAGVVRRGRNVRVGALPQLPVLPAGTVRSAVCAGLDRDAWQGEAMLSRLGMGDVLDTPTDQLSGGQKKRVALAALLAREWDALILDEPTNHLDLESREALEAALEAFPGTVLLVSHDRALLDAVADRMLAVEHQAIASYPGGWADYQQAQEILFQDLPAIPLWYAKVQGGFSSDVSNVHVGWDSVPLYYEVVKSAAK